jgi:hypothetical protein
MNEQVDNPVDETKEETATEEAQDAPVTEEAQDAPVTEESQDTDEGENTEDDNATGEEKHIMCFVSKEMVPISKTVSVPYEGKTSHQVHQRFVKFEFNEEQNS